MLEQKQRIYRFDNFRLDVGNRELLCDGKQVTLPAKAFDMLVVLIESRGRLIEKDELFSRVWPEQIVEESNLTVQVSQIRKALGERKDNPHYIVTVPGHGYRFVGSLMELDEEEKTVIERHSISRLTVEPENGATDEHTLPGILGYETKTFRRPRISTWGMAFLAGLVTTVILLGVVFALRRFRSPAETAPAAPIRSIAVLPFKPLVPGSRDESLEFGMAESLITRLNSLREINVRPMSAVRKYNDLEQDAVTAGRQLQVDSVLDGSLQHAAGRLRVTVKLVRVADGQTLWAEQFDESFTDIFAVQDRLSEKVVGLLALKLSQQELTRLTKRYTDNPAAYEFYVKGGAERSLEKSLEHFQRAIALDPNYGAAYVGLADTYTRLGGARGFRPPRENFPKAKQAAMKALAIDETLADAHVVLATYKLRYEWNWTEAERELRRAVELDAKNVGAHALFGNYFQSLGRFEEAVAERKLTEKFDPVSAPIIGEAGYPLYYARRYDEAIGYYQRALKLDPNYRMGHLVIGQAYVQKRMYEEAIAELRKSLPLSGGDVRPLADLGYVLARAGKRDEAQEVLDGLQRLSQQKYVSAYFIALIYVGLGEKDQAFQWLERAYEERNAHMISLKVEPVFDPLRSDPRFANLVRRVGIPSYPE